MDAELDSPRSREDTIYQRLFLGLTHFMWYWFVFLRRHIIHTVGPVYKSKSEEEKAEKAEQLASAYRTSLTLALENSIRHVVSCLLFLQLAFSRHSIRHSRRSLPASTRILSAMRHGSRWMRLEPFWSLSTGTRSVFYAFLFFRLWSRKPETARESHICGLE